MLWCLTIFFSVRKGAIICTTIYKLERKCNNGSCQFCNLKGMDTYELMQYVYDIDCVDFSNTNSFVANESEGNGIFILLPICLKCLGCYFAKRLCKQSTSHDIAIYKCK